MGAVTAIPTEKNLVEAYLRMLTRYEAWERALPKHAIHQEGCDYGEWVDVMNDRKRSWNGYTAARDAYYLIAKEFCQACYRRGLSHKESLTELDNMIKSGVKY